MRKDWSCRPGREWVVLGGSGFSLERVGCPGRKGVVLGERELSW